MKWIGQHIWDLISRFRGDVYLENISDGTVASDKFLGLDATGKIVKETVTGGGSSVYKRDDTTHPTTVAEFTQGGITYDFVLTNYGSTQQRLSILSQDQTGIYYEYLTRGTQLTFNIGTTNFQNSSGSNILTGTDWLIGDDGNIWQADCQGLNSTMNNMAGGTLTSGSQVFSNRSSSQTFNSSSITIATSDLTGGNLVDFRDDLATSAVDLYYPDDSTWDNGKKTLSLTINLNDGTTAAEKSLTWNFYNKIYHGIDTNATLTGNHASNSGAGSIFNLAHDSFAETSVSVNQSFTTSGAQYYHFAYPYRYGAKTSFQIDGGPATSLYEVTDNLTVVNANGYSERYFHYRTPNSYTDAGPFTITIS
jgi:hypothetical protein